MAKVQSFADKAAKSQRKKEELVNVRIIETVLNKEKNTYKFNYRFVKVKSVDDLAKI